MAKRRISRKSGTPRDILIYLAKENDMGLADLTAILPKDAIAVRIINGTAPIRRKDAVRLAKRFSVDMSLFWKPKEKPAKVDGKRN